MVAYGEIYVEVTADIVNGGIMTLGTSGNIGDGSDTGYYWILWNYNIVGDQYISGGFAGISWYWNDPYNYIDDGWKQSSQAAIYGDGEDGFKKYLIDNPNLENLDFILKEWPNEDKAKFMEQHKSDPIFANCVTFINPN